MTIENIRKSQYNAAIDRLRNNPHWVDIQCLAEPEMTGTRCVLADVITVVMGCLTESEESQSVEEYRHWTSADDNENSPRNRRS